MKLAVRLAQSYPRGGPGRRSYVPGGPLFARRALKFRGVQYAKGEALPVGEMSAKRHLALFRSGLADHSATGPFDRKRKTIIDAASFSKAAEESASANAAFDVSDAAIEQVVAVNAEVDAAIASGAMVEVEPTEHEIERAKSMGADPAQMRSYARPSSGRKPKR